MKIAVFLISMMLCASAMAGLKPKPLYKFAGDMEYAGFCKAILQDDVKRFRSLIRAKVGYLGSTYQSVARKLLTEGGVTCDGEDLVGFSALREASTVHAYLSKVEAKVARVASDATAFQR